MCEWRGRLPSIGAAAPRIPISLEGQIATRFLDSWSFMIDLTACYLGISLHPPCVLNFCALAPFYRFPPQVGRGPRWPKFLASSFPTCSPWIASPRGNVTGWETFQSGREVGGLEKGSRTSQWVLRILFHFFVFCFELGPQFSSLRGCVWVCVYMWGSVVFCRRDIFQ